MECRKIEKNQKAFKRKREKKSLRLERSLPSRSTRQEHIMSMAVKLMFHISFSGGICTGGGEDGRGLSHLLSSLLNYTLDGTRGEKTNHEQLQGENQLACALLEQVGDAAFSFQSMGALETAT